MNRKDYVITAPGHYQLYQSQPSYTVTFHREANVIGTLDFSGPKMTFSGEMEESAQLFIDHVANGFVTRLAKERAEEREACAKVCESQAWDGPRAADDIAAAIRARGEK